MVRTASIVVVVVLLAAFAVGVAVALGGGGAPVTTGSEVAPPAAGGARGATPAPPRRDDPAVAAPDREPAAAALPVEVSPHGVGLVGAVRAAGGAPAGGALVWLVDGDVHRRIATATADPTGRFVLPLGFDDDLGIATFRVAAHHPAHGASELVAVPRPAAGTHAPVDLVLDRPGYTVGGVVRGPAGDPVPGHALTVVRIDDVPSVGPDWLAGRSDAVLVTGPDGAFVARGLRGGRYEIDYEPSDVPLVFDRGLPRLAVEVPAGATNVELRLPFVRLEVDVVEGGTPRRADRVALRAFAPDDAAAAAATHAAGESLERAPLHSESREPSDVARVVAFVPTGAFVVASASVDGRVAEAARLVAAAPAVQALELRLGSEERTPVDLHVLGPDGAPPARVLVRAQRPDGLPVAPAGLPDLGGGWRALPDAGPVLLPAGTLRIELLGDPFEVLGTWYPTATRRVVFEQRVPPLPGRVERTIRLEAGAFVEFQVAVAAAAPTDAARSAWLDERVDGTPVVPAYASIERVRVEASESALLFAWIGDDGRWTAVRGIPHLPGRTVVLRALGTFQPGSYRLAVQTWRPGAIEDARGWPVDLGVGRNLVRLSMDPDGVLGRTGR